jgi:putative ABC transport system permease protein
MFRRFTGGIRALLHAGWGSAAESVWRDVRYGLRMLARNKGFTTVATFALALGIGPNVAIFSIVWAVFLAPLPYPHADRIVMVWSQYKGQRGTSSGDEFAQFRARSTSFDDLAFGSYRTYRITNPDHTESENTGGAGTPLGSIDAPLALGRNFFANEGGPGNDHVVILKHRLWVDRYHSDPEIIGKSILINDEPYAVIGVYVAGFEDRILSSDFVLPLQIVPGVPSMVSGQIIGRLKPGATIAQAQAEIAAVDRQWHAARGGDPSHDWTISVEPLRNDFLDPKTIRNLWLLLAAVGLVLLIACSNVASLLLARGAARRQEIALRSAIGARRRQIFTQVLAESLTLALFGGVVGIALGWTVMKVTAAIAPTLTAETVVEMNIPVLCFALAATLLSGVIFGCAPALHASQLNLSETLKQGSRFATGRARLHTQSLLVVGEFALALTLLSGAGMALHSFWKLSHADLGIRSDHILTGVLVPPSTNRRGPMQFLSPDQIAATNRLLLEKLGSLPGVEDVGFAWSLPPVRDADWPEADLQCVTPGYFSTFGTRLLGGRLFNDHDTTATAPVVVVNQSFVRRYLSRTDPLGESLLMPMLLLGQRPAAPVPHQIIGVLADVANGEHVGDKNVPAIYIAYSQNPSPFMSIAVRTFVDPGSLTPALRSAIGQVAPTLNLHRVDTMDHLVDTQITGDRFSAVLLGSFAIVALLLAAIGIYGVMSFAVTQRTHEIGVRMALGADRGDVVSLMIRKGMRLALIGAVVGLAGTLVLGRLMHSTLYDIGAIDYSSTSLVALILLAVAAVACLIPARRSSRVDPMVALRNE